MTNENALVRFAGSGMHTARCTCGIFDGTAADSAPGVHLGRATPRVCH